MIVKIKISVDTSMLSAWHFKRPGQPNNNENELMKTRPECAASITISWFVDSTIIIGPAVWSAILKACCS